MNLARHLRHTLRLTPAPSPWPRMIFCAFGTVLPLILGMSFDQVPFAIYGSVVAFLLVLNDTAAGLGRRLWNFTATFAFLCAGLYLGMVLATHSIVMMVVIFALSYFIGLMWAIGTELERALLFAAFLLLAGEHSSQMEPYWEVAFGYAFLGFAVITLAALLVTLFLGQEPSAFQRYRDTLRATMTREKHRHLYALGYAFTVLSSFVLVEHWHLDHGYWAVGTVMILIRPDWAESIRRSIQRLFGTLLGSLLAAVLIFNVREPWAILAMVAVVSFWAPWSLARAYWLGSAFVALMILLLMDLPLASHGSLQTTFLRIQATALGCGITILAVLAGSLLKWTQGSLR